MEGCYVKRYCLWLRKPLSCKLLNTGRLSWEGVALCLLWSVILLGCALDHCYGWDANLAEALL